MSCLPSHGRISCTACFNCNSTEFDITKQQVENWRITSNPLSWGSTNPKIIVLGFSKGPTQVGALDNTPHNEIAYKGGRHNVGKIFSHLGLLPKNEIGEFKSQVDGLIKDKTGKYHFASLIRCTVERYDNNSKTWKGSGGGMLDKFVATNFGSSVAKNCISNFLVDLPTETRLIIMFGLGTNLKYVQSAFELYGSVTKRKWEMINSVAYTDGKVIVVHVEHFASQGALIPNWIGINEDKRSQLGREAKEAVIQSGVLNL